MKKFFTVLIRPTAYDTLLLLLYVSLLGSILPTLIPLINMGVTFLFVSLPVLLLLPFYRLRLGLFPPKHPRRIELFLSVLLTASFALDLYSIFRLSYALWLFL